MGSKALRRFSTLMDYVDQLVDAHGNIRNGRGRRHNQEALHRAGVVLTVAAWEAYFELVLTEAHEIILVQSGIDLPVGHANAPPIWSRHLLKSKRQGLKEVVGKMHTPKWQNVQRLAQDWLFIDPTASWQWNAPRRNWTATDMRDCLDEWLRIRHCIAHGADLPSNISWLKGANGRARLVLDHLKACKSEITRMAEQTDSAIESHLVNYYGISHPW